MLIRQAVSQDADAVWTIIAPVFRAGETYTIDLGISREDALSYWLGADRKTFVAEIDGTIVGTYYIRTNQPGGGQHVCNCGYITDKAATGQGVARKMHEHSLSYARNCGYRAMQFNFVVSSNERAVRLWQSLDFEIVGRLPGAFMHPSVGYVDAYVMYRVL